MTKNELVFRLILLYGNYKDNKLTEHEFAQKVVEVLEEHLDHN